MYLVEDMQQKKELLNCTWPRTIGGFYGSIAMYYLA